MKKIFTIEDCIDILRNDSTAYSIELKDLLINAGYQKKTKKEYLDLIRNEIPEGNFDLLYDREVLGLREEIISDNEFTLKPTSIISHFQFDAGSWGLRYFVSVKNAYFAILYHYYIIEVLEEERNLDLQLVDLWIDKLEKIEILSTWAELTDKYEEACEFLSKLICGPAFTMPIREYIYHDFSVKIKTEYGYKKFVDTVSFWSYDAEEEAIKKFNKLIGLQLNCGNIDHWNWILSKLKATNIYGVFLFLI